MNSYDERISRVCEYIQHNLNNDLSLDCLSAVAAFSKYHFHRVFVSTTGITVSRYIQLARLRRASFRLAFEKETRVIDIALEAGFESPEAFTRAFKRTFDQTPSAFRGSPQWPEWHLRFQKGRHPYGEKMMKVEIVDFESTSIALIEHLGSPDNVFETASRFIEWRKETGLSPVKTCKTFGIPYSDPNHTPADEFRWDICGEHNGEVPANDHGVIAGVIPGGRCAKVRHHGSYDSMDNTVYYLYRDWLTQSGEELRDFPVFFEYLNFVHEVDECDLVTDVYLPIK